MSRFETEAERADAYVLGLMDDDEIARIEADLETDLSLQAAVGVGRDRFVELDLAGREGEISPDLWERIARTIDGGGSRGEGQGRAATAGPVPDNDNRLVFWRRMTASAVAASAVLVAGLAYLSLHPPVPKVIAVLMNAAGQPIVMVEDFGDADARLTPLVDYAVPDNRTLQVWTLPSKTTGPVSLGVLEGWRSVTVGDRDLPAPHEEQLYEITIEPAGGSPTGRPTGPVLGKGFARAPRI
ncbi:anti-sigma factor [Rhizobium halophytocola]|uniref:Anti-sigma-K factor RskA n=1 Tax=Rhizobium halophytocola TaxID=735519 RepID=A0ABS4E5H4_9HYPH|nr:anti-sigma factor [Rhizobium halophytocola]MBP1853168.1 anti-sigma-K factor RskA [Rhizobium halophytocola]